MSPQRHTRPLVVRRHKTSKNALKSCPTREYKNRFVAYSQQLHGNSCDQQLVRNNRSAKFAQ